MKMMHDVRRLNAGMHPGPAEDAVRNRNAGIDDPVIQTTGRNEK
jgi:hypothetical protein